MSEWISDFTPTIQDMRETYEETHFYAPHTNSVKEKNAEFDRFLELVYQVERERIIKLLEDEQWHDMVFAKEVVVNGEVYHGWRKNHSMACNGCKQIALIKGETSE